MAIHNNRGKEAEARAAVYLQQRGYEIHDVNWTFGRDEIDLIAGLPGCIIFVEVKCRSNLAFGAPEDFVTPAKQRRLARAAEAYVHLMGYNGEIRFDIIAATLLPGGDMQLKHIEDAFWPING